MHVRLNEGAPALDVLNTVTGIGDPELAGDALSTRGIALWMTGRDSEALAQLDTAPTSSGGCAWEADLLAVRGMVHLYAGNLPEALSDLDDAVGLSHLWRPSTNQSRIYVMRSTARYHRGDWDGALSDAAAARALATQAEAWSAVWAFGASIDVPANRGQGDIAADHLTAAKAAMATLPYGQVVDWVARHESTIHITRGDHEALLGLLEPLVCEQHFRELASYRSHRWILPAWISTLIEVGRLADAGRALDWYAAMLGRSPGGLGPGRLGWLSGLLAQARGDPDAAREHFRAELADAATVATPFFHGRVLRAAGRLEQAVGRRRPAIQHLTAAYTVFAGLRATPFVQRCRVDLEASGMGSAGDDPHTMTERQEDVAALVSRGYTNKEVARELFMSTKAVEYHLRGIYTKLGITSRHDLRRLRTAAHNPYKRSLTS